MIHGARGLYELIETNDEKVIEAVLSHGGLDAAIYLCNMVHGYELHALATSSLAALAEHKHIQSVIVAKRAMPRLFHLVSAYVQHAIAPARPPSPPMGLIRMASMVSVHTKGVRRIETIAVVLMNITHIVSQMVPDKLLAKQLVMEGAIDTLMCLCVYFPTGIRTRAMEEAIRTMSQENNASERSGEKSTTNSASQPRGSIDENHQSQQGNQSYLGEGLESNEGILLSMDDVFHARLESMQGLAAKCISMITADVSNQAFIVDEPERINRLVQLLYSTNLDVVKYVSKTMAYLSLRNDRYKPDIVKGSGAAALLSVIHTAISGDNHILSNPNGINTLADAVSHACCALANLATNTESQEILMSHMDLLSVTCAVVGMFPHQREVERHVARLVANLALYGKHGGSAASLSKQNEGVEVIPNESLFTKSLADQNKLALLTAYNSSSESRPTDSSYLSQQHRYSSPPPPVRRARNNVIPTLLFIGALTLEREGPLATDQEITESFLIPEQDTIDFMNDEGSQPLGRANPGYLTPTDSPSENDILGQDHRALNQMTIANESNCSGNADEGEQEDEELSEWRTVPGMEDVQRHIVRAIDNLMTSVTDDPLSNQSFKVFSRVWPTIGLVKTIQMTNKDEDTQRRAMHVLSTLIQQQEIHADAIAVLKQQQRFMEEPEEHHQQEHVRNKKAVHNEQEHLEQERLEQERLEQERLEQRRLEQERLERERLEQECLEQERLEKKRAKKERFENEQLERVLVERKRVENERLEQERLEQERLEQERLEQERLEQERTEKERVVRERLERARAERERERLEKGLQEKEHVKQEQLVQIQLKQERIEQDRAKRAEDVRREGEEKHAGEDLQRTGRQVSEDARTHPVSEDMVQGAGSKGGSSSEDQTTSQDEAPKAKEKNKDKKKKKKGSK
ncbi:hypothetical protein BGZ54_010016 [Gamsiella multidivaricata]|nr:hypothetical protein BGZ54_010016 [Gamsiella multidivaricata]